MTRVTSPYGYRSTAMDVVAGHDLSGRFAIVTGATSGIGLETARALAAAGASTTIAARDPAKAEAAAADIRQSTGSDRAHALTLDLAALSSVRRFSAEFLSRDNPLHILINNAGVMACPLGRTAEGFEMQLGTNHLGHFLLALLLRPALERGRPARVVALSSLGHRRSDVHFDDPNYERRPYDKWEAYGQSKTANVLFAVGLTERWAERGIHANAVHPGGIMTGLQKHLPREEMQTFGWIDAEGRSNERFKTPAQGAATSVWAAVGEELRDRGGLYLEDCQEAKAWTQENPMQGYLPYARSTENADRLWVLSEELVAGGAAA
jgi:NAD(P)-dependent dehydrogenase (short-subunit alcohol dehydrogenase family)